MRKEMPENFKLDEEQLKSFHTIIEKICSPPVLALPRPNFPYSVDTDASSYVIDYTMFQAHEDGTRKPIGY